MNRRGSHSQAAGRTTAVRVMIHRRMTRANRRGSHLRPSLEPPRFASGTIAGHRGDSSWFIPRKQPAAPSANHRGSPSAAVGFSRAEPPRFASSTVPRTTAVRADHRSLSTTQLDCEPGCKASANHRGSPSAAAGCSRPNRRGSSSAVEGSRAEPLRFAPRAAGCSRAEPPRFILGSGRRLVRRTTATRARSRREPSRRTTATRAQLRLSRGSGGSPTGLRSSSPGQPPRPSEPPRFAFGAGGGPHADSSWFTPRKQPGDPPSNHRGSRRSSLVLHDPA